MSEVEVLYSDVILNFNKFYNAPTFSSVVQET
jgi:hypothetical protein